MFFSININTKNIRRQVALLRMQARRTLVLFPRRATEVEIDKYLQRKYHTSLIVVCLKIWSNAKFNIVSNNEIVVLIPNKKLDEIAALITYGNGKMNGSQILKKAFSHYERS